MRADVAVADLLSGKGAAIALPEGVVFKTKHQLAREILKGVVSNAYLPLRWVTADEAYGDDHNLRQEVEDLGLWYCFEVSKNSEVWSEDPQWEVPPTRLAEDGRKATNGQRLTHGRRNGRIG